MTTTAVFGIVAAAAAAGPVTVDRRDIQIRSVDFDSGVLELHNSGPVGQVLVGWRFCSHDSDEIRRYTSSTGLNGAAIDTGESLFIYTNNDAPPGDENVNLSSLGGTFALPLDPNAYGVQLYFPNMSGVVSFGDSTLIADHVQWNIAGQSAGLSEARTAQAVGQGLWSGTGDFIETSADSTAIELTDIGDGRAHGPSNYTVSGPACAADLSPDGSLDFADVSAFLTLFSSMDLSVDFDDSGSIDFGDVSAFLALFAVGCP